ncbi:hypothetical protein BdWA1_001281 [Babesia duncani]|uniref:Uncharacterized protein n=1 Tax=Babesia duncani TaxID=323732 RepID=A0AAD9PPF7_9APIC|nr:hypothetical protein BdWA1_001281 [Babesia duncani]
MRNDIFGRWIFTLRRFPQCNKHIKSQFGFQTNIKCNIASIPQTKNNVAFNRSIYTLNSRDFATQQSYVGKNKSEATVIRKVHATGDNVEMGPPTFTLFTENVCLTVKATNDESSSGQGLLFTAMKRLQEPSRQFNKNSRVSSVLPLEQLDRLQAILREKSNEEFTIHGIDGGSIVIACSHDCISIKLNPSLIPGQTLIDSKTPSTGHKLNAKINFLGGLNEVTLISYALDNISESLQQL